MIKELRIVICFFNLGISNGVVIKIVIEAAWSAELVQLVSTI